MKYKILCIGKVKESFYRDEIDNVMRLIRKKDDSITITEFPDIKIPDNLKESGIAAFLEKECEPIISDIDRNEYVIALCIEGKELTTIKHKSYVDKAAEMGKDCITYVIGGSLGLSNTVKNRADLKLSFSALTFPHQLMRMVLLEEIYHL